MNRPLRVLSPVGAFALMVGLFASGVATLIGASSGNAAGNEIRLQAECSWTGTWNTNFNRMYLTQSGSAVTGN